MSILTPYEIAGDLEQGTGAFPPPVLSVVDPNVLGINVTEDITLYGSFFTPTTTVVSSSGVVNLVTFITDNEILINYTSPAIDSVVDLTLDNGQSATFPSIINVVQSTWTDLRLGNTYTHGNAPGNDIRYRTGMTMVQDADGMYFTGSNPWSSWVKFENLQWTRGELKTCSWITTSAASAMMMGIGSTTTNETSTAQYYQSEVVAYLQNATTLWGLFGNNGTVGSGGTQANSTPMGSYAAYRISFSNDGSAGGLFEIYGLPSVNDSDWDDTTNLVASFIIAGTVNPDEIDIMPFLMPRDTTTQRFLAVKVEL